MLDETIILKLKNVAKKLGKNWVLDLVNSTERNIIFRRARDLEINLYKKWGTKFKYSIYPNVLCCGSRRRQILLKSYPMAQLNLSVKNIADKILSALPADINKIIQEEHLDAQRKEQEALTHEYFIHALKKMGELKHCSNLDNYRNCAIAINNKTISLYHDFSNLYTFSVKIDREMIIKLLRVLNE